MGNAAATGAGATPRACLSNEAPPQDPQPKRSGVGLAPRSCATHSESERTNLLEHNSFITFSSSRRRGGGTTDNARKGAPGTPVAHHSQYHQARKQGTVENGKHTFGSNRSVSEVKGPEQHECFCA